MADEQIGIKISGTNQSAPALSQLEDQLRRNHAAAVSAGNAFNTFGQSVEKQTSLIGRFTAGLRNSNTELGRTGRVISVAATTMASMGDEASGAEVALTGLVSGAAALHPALGAIALAVSKVSDKVFGWAFGMKQVTQGLKDAEAQLAASSARLKKAQEDVAKMGVLGIMSIEDEMRAFEKAMNRREQRIAKRKQDEESAARAAMTWNQQVAEEAVRLSFEEAEAARVAGEAKEEAARVAADAEREAAKRTAEYHQEMAAISVSAFGSIIQQAIETGDLSAEMFVDVAERSIMAAASGAAAQAAFATAGIPIIGPVLATTAAAVMFAFVKKYMKHVRGADGGEIQRFAAGGDVHGGLPGRDSVHGLLMPGERVLTVHENHALKTLARSVSRGRVLRGGFHAAMGGEAMTGHGMGMTVQITAPIQNPEEMTKDQIDRWLVRINRRAEDLHKAGLFMRTARVA